MNRYLLPLAVVLLTACNSSEETTTTEVREAVATIVEYKPAPGQFINEPLSGYNEVLTPKDACNYVVARFAKNDYVSLGGWGGYVIAKFKESVPVRADGGYEIYIVGNQFETSSEPGVVWVAQDANRDGQPDEWYELKGSEWNNPKTIHNYRITYTPPLTDNTPIQWSDSEGNSGAIDRVDDHTQPSYFPTWVTGGELIFEGTRLPDNIDYIDNEWIAQPFAWGYADNYASSARKGMTNFFRIGDAVTTAGTAAKLTSIDFIKVQTGVNAQAPLIGEISTEVCGMGCIRIITKQE